MQAATAMVAVTVEMVVATAVMVTVMAAAMVATVVTVVATAVMETVMADVIVVTAAAVRVVIVMAVVTVAEVIATARAVRVAAAAAAAAGMSAAPRAMTSGPRAPVAERLCPAAQVLGFDTPAPPSCVSVRTWPELSLHRALVALPPSTPPAVALCTALLSYRSHGCSASRSPLFPSRASVQRKCLLFSARCAVHPFTLAVHGNV